MRDTIESLKDWQRRACAFICDTFPEGSRPDELLLEAGVVVTNSRTAGEAMPSRLKAIEIGQLARRPFLTVEEVGYLRGWAYRLPTAVRKRLEGNAGDLMFELEVQLDELSESCDVLNETWQARLVELCIFRDDLESLLWVVREAPEDVRQRSVSFAEDLVDFDEKGTCLVLALPENLIRDERLSRIDPLCWWSLKQ